DLAGVEWNVSRILQSEESMQHEVERVLDRILEVHRNGLHIVLYSSGSPNDVANARMIGRRRGKDVKAVSDFVSRTLGSITAKAVEACDVKYLMLTGGDTAKQVCLSLGANELELI